MCYNRFMKKLYYATFESGFGEIVKKIIKKNDKNSRIKTLYDDAVLFFADEHFKFKDLCFFDAFIVMHNLHKTGVGALNLMVKSLLEKKDLKIALPKESGTVKLTIKKENENTLLDAKLKNAFEVMVKRITKRGISFFASSEIVLLSKKDGENLFMKRVETTDKYVGLAGKYDIRPETAFLLCYLSEPKASEVVLDANASNGIIPFVRANSFSKANVISASKDEEVKEKLKRLAKKIKPNTFSVLGYNFLDDNFPIKFIDKIVTDVTDLGFRGLEELRDFFDKAFELNVKTLVLAMPKNYDVRRYILNRYDIDTEIVSNKMVAVKLMLKGSNN